MQIERINSSAFVENKLPDGSRTIVDEANEKIYALNATAGAAWDACSAPTTLSGIKESMSLTMGSNVGEDVAEQAVLELQEQKLVAASGSSWRPSRRQMIMGFGAVAVPVVASLTLGQQRVYAAQAKSGPSGPSWPNQPKCDIWCQIEKDF
jgi:hypothetical protein